MSKNDTSTKFIKMVNSSTYLQKRHAMLANGIKDSLHDLGVQIDDDALADSSSFRIACYGTRDVHVDQILVELTHVPAVIEYNTLQNLIGRLQASENIEYRRENIQCVRAW